MIRDPEHEAFLARIDAIQSKRGLTMFFEKHPELKPLWERRERLKAIQDISAANGRRSEDVLKPVVTMEVNGDVYEYVPGLGWTM